MTGMDAEFRKRLLATFREEAEEHIGGIVDLLLALEREGSQSDPTLVERIYRTTHSLKGAARAVNQKEIESVCQNLENVFSRMKKGTFVPDSGAFDVFHQSVKVIQALLAAENPSGISTVEIVAAIRATSRRDASAGDSALSPTAPIISPLSEHDQPQGGASPGTDGIALNHHFTEHPRSDVRPATMKDVHDRPAPDTGTVRIAAHKLDRLIAGSDDLLTTRLFMTHRLQELEEIIARFTLWRWNHAMISSDLHRIRERSFGSGRKDIPEDLLLPIQRLVEFFDYDREFVTYLQHDLAEHIRETERDRSALEASTSEISDLIHDAVLLPVSSILSPFPGLVREYSRNTGKQVELLIEGGEIEVDRRILDSLRDPLMHLIYNSIDHGIEYPDIRMARNKPPRGQVRIKAFPISGGKVGIEVTDDGGGIDGHVIRQAAVRAGLITEAEEARLSDTEAIWLIFRSGLSTSPIITEISGRGLGLAIVEDTLTRLGGFVTISSDVGKGTGITLRVPVRLVTFRGVVVRSGSHVYVIPMPQVRQVLRVKYSSIIRKGNRPVIPFNNEMISVLWLSDLLGVPHTGQCTDVDGQVPLVIIAYGAGQVACLVDDVVRVQEIVVRPLGSQLHRVKRIAGAAILGDGTLALVLDPPELIQESLKSGGVFPSAARVDRSAPRVLVVEDSVTSRAFLQVLLERDGFLVQTATDGMEAFAILKEHELDIVVSDVDMPRMNGFVLTEKIRADARLAALPVILVTSLDSAEDQKHGVAVGADAYIVKSSFEKTSLLSVIRTLLATRKKPGPEGRSDDR